MGETMEFKGQGPSNTNRTSQPQPVKRMAGEGNSFSMIERDSNKKPWIIGAIVAAVLLIGGVGIWKWSAFMGGDGGIKTAQYQAIFLTNGQVYFGKLAHVNEKYISLSDIYYLQVQQSVQPTDKNASAENPQVSLAKLGSELHGPEDQMYINRDQVLFWENLKDNGKVVDAIHKNQQKQ